MKPKTVIHLVTGKPIKSAETLHELASRWERISPGGTLPVTRLTDHGTEKKVLLAPPSILRLEDA